LNHLDAARSELVSDLAALLDHQKTLLLLLKRGMLAVAQTVEHYEIARYGTLIAWADQLGMKEASTLLGEILAEEKKTDQLLTRLAEANINQKAA
jgi:ferritin-like metal-binding protein YciE